MTTTCNQVTFVLPIAPMPAPRPRARGFLAGKRVIISLYSPPNYKEWQKEALAALKLLAEEEVPPTPFTGPLFVEVHLSVQKPKTTKLPHPKPDVDNYAKAVLDALTADGRFWSDDSQVQTLLVDKGWSDASEILVRVRAA